MNLSVFVWLLLGVSLALVVVVFLVRRWPPKCSECGRRTSWRSNGKAVVLRWPLLAWFCGPRWRYAVCRCGHVDYSMQVESCQLARGVLSERDRANLDAFLGSVLDDYKNNSVEREVAVSALAHVVVELDAGNVSEVQRWLEQGRKLIREG